MLAVFLESVRAPTTVFLREEATLKKKPAVENEELLCRYICGRFPSLPAIKKSIEKIGRGNQSTF